MARRPKVIRVAPLVLAFQFLFADRILFGADTRVVLDRWFAAQNNVRTWSADFIQTRTFPTLTQPLMAGGHVDFAMSGEFRWELGRPARTIAVGRPDEMFVIYPALKRAEHYPLGPNAPRQWRDVLSLLQAGFPRNRGQFEAQFHLLSLTETNQEWEFVLESKSEFARRMMPQLRVRVATNDFSPRSMELIFADGSRMRNDFTNAVLNPDVGRETFNWRPPADFKLTEPFSK